MTEAWVPHGQNHVTCRHAIIIDYRAALARYFAFVKLDLDIRAGKFHLNSFLL